ncbi:hypothetical protein C8R44DRAFT_176872 [Mycena epipterygia]|nr:hypothetical protein C8R44DRAFT_176872 [Mycena epipterygia]
MAFISNCDRLTLGDGVYNNVHGNIVHNTFYGKKRRREEIDDGSDFASSHPTSRRRREEEDGIKQVIRMRNLKLTDEIGNGPGYFLHAGKNKGRAVVVKVFNTGPTAREVRRTLHYEP